MRKILLLKFLILGVLFYSQEYVLVDENDDELFYLRNEGNNEAWVKVISKIKKIKNKKGNWITTGGDYKIFNIRCDKSAKTIAVGRTILYNKNGKYIEQSGDDIDLSFGDKIIPDSMGEFFCSILWNEEREMSIGAKDDYLSNISSYMNGYKEGYLEEKCKPYTVESCEYKTVPFPKEYNLSSSKNLHDDYTYGYYDGVNAAKLEKKK